MDFTIPEELRHLRRLVRRFVQEELLPLERRVEEGDDFPDALRLPLREKAVKLGLWNYAVPERYGGGGVGMLGEVLVQEELGKVSVAVGMQGGIIGGSSAFMGAPPDELPFATQEHMERYFLPVIRGEMEFFIALTEPNAGSDAAAIETTALRRGDSYVLKGTKVFITALDRSAFGFVYAVTDPGKRGKGISCFLVEKDTPGFLLERRIPVMGRRGLKNYEVRLEDCLVPASNLLGEEGQGLTVALSGLAKGRLRLGGACIGAAERALGMARDYAKMRVTFGQPLAQRQAVQWMLVDSSIDIYATRMMAYNAAWEADQGGDIRTRAAMIKVYATEMCLRAVDRAIQIHGGLGYSKDLPLEMIYRDMRLYPIGEGPNEVMRYVIARDLLRD